MSQTLWWRLETRGEWFAYLDRGPTGTGEPVGIYPLIGMGVDLIVDGTADRPWDSTLVGFAVEKDGLRKTLLPDEVLWVHYPDPDDPWAPMPPLRAALPALGLDATAVAFQAGQFRNAHRPSGVLYLGDVDAESHEKVEASIRARHEGADNAGRTLVLSGPVPSKYERFGLTADEVGYLNTRATNAEEVMLAFGIPKDYLMGGATYENRAASRQTLWSDTILPKADVIASELDRQVFPQVDLTATFDVTRVDALQESIDSIIARQNTLVRADVVTLNEARGAVGLDSLPWGEVTLTAYRSGFAKPAVQTASWTARALPEPTHPALEARAANPLSHANVTRVTNSLVAVGNAATEAMLAKQKRQVTKNAEQLWGPSRSAANKRRAMLAPGAALIRSVGDDLVRGCESIATETLRPFLAQSWEAGLDTYSAALGLDPQEPGARAETALLAANRLAAVASSTTATLAELLARALAEAFAAEMEAQAKAALEPRLAPDLPDWVQEAMTRVWNYSRGDGISVTEAFAGFNGAGFRTAMRANTFTKAWTTMRDDRVRASHADLDGMTLDMTSVFPNGCAYPHDPDGFAEETINCRCWLVVSIDGE
jgi:HK97 family phage portal protein